MNNTIILSLIISFLNGIFFFLSISHFKLSKYDYLIAGLTGICSYLIFSNLVISAMHIGFAVFLRIFIWFFFCSIVYSKNHPSIKLDYIFFRIAIIITLKLFFEKIILSNTSHTIYSRFFPNIFSWIPLLLIGAVLDKKTTSNLKNKNIHLIKMATTSLCTICLVYAYYFILKNFN